MKIYQMWPGKDRFCCGLRTGPAQDLIPNLYLHGSILIPLVVYLVFCSEKLWNQVTPAIPITNCLLYLATQAFILATSFTDPGIIPNRQLLNILVRDKKVSEEQANFFLEGDGEATKCTSCDIFKPKRSSHCRECNHCVQVLDHHCPFVNACVAKRNYQFFFSFLCSLMIYIGSIILGVVFFLIVLAGSQISKATINIVIIVVSVAFGLILLVLGGFLLVHCCLLFRGKTTREVLKKQQQGSEQKLNWFYLDPVLVDFEHEVEALLSSEPQGQIS